MKKRKKVKRRRLPEEIVTMLRKRHSVKQSKKVYKRKRIRVWADEERLKQIYEE